MNQIETGINCSFDTARRRTRQVSRVILGDAEQKHVPLSPDFPLSQVTRGGFVSVHKGRVAPLNATLGFGGILDTLYADARGLAVAVLLTRVKLYVTGLGNGSPGQPIYVDAHGKLTLQATPIQAGQLLAPQPDQPGTWHAGLVGAGESPFDQPPALRETRRVDYPL